MGHRLSKMKGLSAEEKDILVRIGDLVDGTINNRAPTNPFEPHSPERRDPRLPSIRSVESEEGVRSTVLTWDPADASILAYYKLEITNLSTGTTKTFVSYTNRFVYKDSSGDYMVRLFTIGKNQTASPPIKFLFTLANSVMFLNGECNGIGTVGQTSVCTDIFIPAQYFVHVWVSFNYNGLADPQNNLSPIIQLKQTGNPDNIDLAHMPVIQSIQVFPESITLVNIDDNSTQAEITRPTTIAVRDADGHYDTSMAIMFSAFQVQTADAGQVNRLCAEVTRRTEDIDNLCISAWVASSGITDFISGSIALPDCREPDFTTANQNFTPDTYPFSNSAADAEAYAIVTGMEQVPYINFFQWHGTVSGSSLLGGVSHRPGWRLNPNLIEAGNAQVIRGLISARDNVSDRGVQQFGFARRTPDDNTPEDGYVLTMRQDGSEDVSDTMQHSVFVAWSLEAFGIEGRDFHDMPLGNLVFGFNDNDASTTSTMTIAEGREGIYFFCCRVGMEATASQTGWPLAFRYNWALDGVDLKGVRSNNMTGSTYTGRGFMYRFVRRTSTVNPTMEHESFICGIVNLTAGTHTIQLNANIHENVTPLSSTRLAATRAFFARTDNFNLLSYHQFTGKLSTLSTTFTDIGTLLGQDLSITIESDLNVVVMFHTSVAGMNASHPRFQMYQNGTALFGSEGVWHETWQNTDFAETDIDTDADLHPFTMFRFINNPGFSTFNIRMKNNNGTVSAIANVADDGSATYKGFFAVMELNFCT